MRALLLVVVAVAIALAGAASAVPACIVSGPFIRYYSSGNGIWRGSVLVVTPPIPSLRMNIQLGPAAATTLTGTRLYARTLPDRKIEVWRVQLTLRQQNNTVPVRYWFPGLSKCGRFPTLGPKFTFHLAGGLEEFHWAFHSCTDESEQLQPGYFKRYPRGANNTWGDLLARHTANPFHLLVGLGDQIYNDLVVQVPALARVWKSAKHRKDRLALWRGIKWTPVVQKQVTDFYVLNYLRKFAHPVMSVAFASIPSSHMWDDHEVFDGMNDQDPAVTALPIYNQIIRAGSIFFRLFQQHTTAQLPSSEVFFKPGFSTLKRLGPSTVLLQMDTRTERTRKHFVTPASYGIVMAQLAKLPASVDFLFVATGDPVVAPSFRNSAGKAVPALSKLANMISEWGDDANMDDSIGLWQWPTRHAERAALVKRMQGVAKSKSARVIFIGGDVHSTGMGSLRTQPFIKDSKDYRYMPGFTSSAIGVAPMPEPFCRLYNLFAASPTIMLGGTTTLQMLPAFKDSMIKGRCGDGQYWINHRNYAEVMPVESGKVKVTVWYEADDKDSNDPFRSFGATVPALRL